MGRPTPRPAPTTQMGSGLARLRFVGDSGHGELAQMGPAAALIRTHVLGRPYVIPERVSGESGVSDGLGAQDGQVARPRIVPRRQVASAASTSTRGIVHPPVAMLQWATAARSGSAWVSRMGRHVVWVHCSNSYKPGGGWPIFSSDLVPELS
jgi:hypothetical protein